MLGYGITAFLGNLTVNMCIPALLTQQEQLDQALIAQGRSILTDVSHVLFSEYVFVELRRRYRVPLCNHKCLKHSYSSFNQKCKKEREVG